MRYTPVLFLPEVVRTVVEANPALQSTPEVVNTSPYEEGWLAVVRPSAWESDGAALLEPAAYLSVMEAQAREEVDRK